MVVDWDLVKDYGFKASCGFFLVMIMVMAVFGDHEGKRKKNKAP